MSPLRNRAPLALLLLPAALLLGPFFFYPLSQVVHLSVEGGPHWYSNFAAFLDSPVFRLVTLRTFEISLFVTTVCLLLAYPTAAFLAHAPKRLQKWLVLCIVVPYLTSLLVRTYAWVVLLNDQGLINRILMISRLITDPLPLLYSRFGMLVGMVHILLPMMVLPIYASMLRTDTGLLRAARSLGAGPLRTFLKVYLPQTVPGVRSGCVLVFIVALGFYITPMALGGLSDIMLSNLIAQQITTAVNFPMASVIALAMLAATLFFYAALGLVPRRLGASALRRPAANSRLRVGTWWPQTWAAQISKVLWQRNLERMTTRGRWSRYALASFGLLTLLYLVFPSLLVVVVSFNAGEFLSFPPDGWSLRWYRSFFEGAEWTQTALLSVRIGLLSMITALALGTMAAFAISRWPSVPVRRILYALMLAPMIVPPVITAIGAFTVLAKWGMVGTVTAIVLEHACIGLTFVVVVVGGTLASFDLRLEQAAASLGAGQLRTFLRVTLPIIAPGVVAAGLFAFISSFDEVVLTSFIAGNETRTMPLKMWEDIRNQVDPTIAAVSSLLILLPILALPLLGRHVKPIDGKVNHFGVRSATIG
jgi:putative spermidine/putrescine transport system permease protein